MADPVVFLLLSLATCCLIVMTWAVVLTALELRRTLHRLNTVLPSAETALNEIARSFQQLRRLLRRLHHAARQVETIVHGARDVASATARRLHGLQQRIEAMLFGHHGNGAGAEPRRHHSGRSGTGRSV